MDDPSVVQSKKSRGFLSGLFKRPAAQGRPAPSPPEIIENAVNVADGPDLSEKFRIPEMPRAPEGSGDSIAKVRAALGLAPLPEPERPPAFPQILEKTKFEEAHDRASAPIRSFLLTRSIGEPLEVPEPPSLKDLEAKTDVREPAPLEPESLLPAFDITAETLALPKEGEEAAPFLSPFEIEAPAPSPQAAPQSPAPPPPIVREAPMEPPKPLPLAGLKGRMRRKGGRVQLEITGAQGEGAGILEEAKEALESQALASSLDVSAAPLSEAEVGTIMSALATNEDLLQGLKRLENEHRSIRKELGRMIARPLQAQDLARTIDELKAKLARVDVPAQPKAAFDKGFVLSDCTLFNATDLLKSLRQIPETEFAQHVTESKNAFADWVAEALGMEGLARTLRPLRTREAMLEALKAWNSVYVASVNEARRAARAIQQEIRETEAASRKALGRYEFKHFFRLHRPDSLQTLLKLLQTLEYLYKTDTGTVIIHNKEDFNRWVRAFIEGQRRAEAARNAPLKEVLAKTLDEHAAVIWADMDQHAKTLLSKRGEVGAAQALLQEKMAEISRAMQDLERLRQSAIAELVAQRTAQLEELAGARRAQESDLAGKRAAFEADMGALRQAFDDEKAKSIADMESHRTELELQAKEHLARRQLEVDDALHRRIGELDAQRRQLEEGFRQKQDELHAHFRDEEARCRRELDEAKAAYLESLHQDRMKLSQEQADLEIKKQAWLAKQAEESERLTRLREDVEKRQKNLDAELDTLREAKARIVREHEEAVRELEGRQRQLEQTIKALEQTLEQELGEHRRRLDEEARSARKAAEEERRKSDTSRQIETSRLQDLQAHVEEEGKRLERAREHMAAQEDRIRAEIERQKAEMRANLEEMRKLDASLSQVESRILAGREALEKEGFRKYLDAKLKEIRSAPTRRSAGEPGKEEGGGLPTEAEADETLYWDFYKDMAHCQTLLSNKQLDEAKALYTDIKNRFNGSNLPQEKKTQLYHSIRELYEDIATSLQSEA